VSICSSAPSPSTVTWRNYNFRTGWESTHKIRTALTLSLATYVRRMTTQIMNHTLIAKPLLRLNVPPLFHIALFFVFFFSPRACVSNIDARSLSLGEIFPRRSDVSVL
jgi:hypothetical protein